MSRYFEIGKIVNTQGLRGEVRVIPHTDDPNRFELLNEVEVCAANRSMTLQLEGVRYHKGFVLLKFKGVDDIDAAAKLKDSIIKIPDELALPLGEDEYYIRDLYGMKVVTEEGVSLGEISDIIHTGANDVYVVSPSDKKSKQQDILLPAIKGCIMSVDTGENIMVVKLPEGLVD